MRARAAHRRIIAWGASAAGAVLAVLWWLGGSRVFGIDGPGGVSATIAGGTLNVVLDADEDSRPESPRTGVRTYYSDYEWWFDGGWEPRFKWVVVPLWFPLPALAVAAERAWRAGRRAARLARAGSCPRCGYDRAGLASRAACPECGQTPAAR